MGENEAAPGAASPHAKTAHGPAYIGEDQSGEEHRGALQLEQGGGGEADQCLLASAEHEPGRQGEALDKTWLNGGAMDEPGQDRGWAEVAAGCWVGGEWLSAGQLGACAQSVEYL